MKSVREYLDPSLVVDEKAKTIKNHTCPICLHIAMKPYMQCQACSRLYCKECIDDYKTENCKTCTTGKMAIQNHNLTIADMEFKCKNHEKGCQVVKESGDILLHHQNCSFDKC
jgi:hypothetical protein